MTTTTSTSDPPATHERPVYPSLAALRLAHSKLLAGFDRNNPSPAILHEIEEFLRAGRLTGWMLSDEERRNAAQSILDYWSAVLYRAKRQPPESALIPFGPPVRYADVECPYPGLAPFDAQLRDFFLGRQAVVDELVAKLKATRVMVVTGPRGCGKSSLVRAGLLPELQSGVLPGSDRWSYVGPFVPGSRPLESLARALRQAQAKSGDQESSTSAAELQGDAAALTNAVRQLGPALLFVDQLEDVLPAPGESLDAERTAFINCLVDLARATDIACVLVATRTDEVIEPSFHAADVLLAEAARADVPDLGTRELRDAIQLPAELVGVTFDEEVVPDLVRALVGVPVAPPLLQFVLTSLWERRVGRVISWDSYRALMWDPRRRRSNAAYAIGRAAQERYQSLALDPPAQAALKSILLQLIVPVEGADVLLRRLRVSQLRRGRGTDVPPPEGFDRAMRELVAARLVRCSTAAEDDDPNDSAVEVVHVALARNWPDLDQWLVEVRIEQERRRRLQAATKEWLDHQRSDEALWREALLEGLDEHDPGLGAAEREFIVQSRRVARRRERRRARRRWMWRAAGAVFVVLAGTVALLAQHGTQVARSHQLLAETHQTDDPAAALLMAVSAYQFNSDNDARVGVLDLLQRNRQLEGILGAYGPLTATAASADGALLAAAETVPTGGTHADVVLWNGTTLAEIARLDMSVVDKIRRVRALAFDASHARLAVVFDNGSVSIWDTRSGQPMHWQLDASQPDQLVLTGRAQPLSALAFDSRNGHDWLVSIGQDGVVTWDLPTGQLARQYAIAQRPGAALSPDGTLVAAIGCAPDEVVSPCPSPKTLRVWDTATAQLVWPAIETRDPASGVWFSAQSDLLALAGPNGVEVRDARALDSVRALRIPTGPVVQMVVDSQSGLLVTAACELIAGGRGCATEKDAHVQAFDINTWAAAGPQIPVDPNAVQALALLPSTTASGSGADPTLRVVLRQPSGVAVLDTQNDRVGLDPLALADDLGGLGPNVVRVGRDRVAVLGCVVAVKGAACPPGALHLADGRTGNSIGQNLVGEPPVGVTTLAATSDGGILASGRVDGRVDVWDVASGVNRSKLMATDSGGRISALAFAPDGRLAASAARNLRLWMLDNPQAPRAVELPSTSAQTSALAFSPDSTLLGSGGSDGTLEIWSVTTGASTEPRAYRGQASPITSIAFSPDRRLVAASGSTRKVLIWDVESAKLIGAPLVASNLEAVASLAFSADGRTLTAGDGQQIAAWRLDLSGTDFVRRACQIAHRNLSSDEWKKLQIDAPWTPACPEWRS